MAERMTIPLYQDVQAHAALAKAWSECIKPMIVAGNRLVLEVKPETRSSAQNRLLWARLGEIAKHVDWYGKKLSADDWKTMFTAALRRERVVPGINGGFVVLGQSTSRMTRSEMCDLQELISAFGAERGVTFTAPEYINQETGEIE